MAVCLLERLFAGKAVPAASAFARSTILGALFPLQNDDFQRVPHGGGCVASKWEFSAPAAHVKRWPRWRLLPCKISHAVTAGASEAITTCANSGSSIVAPASNGKTAEQTGPRLSAFRGKPTSRHGKVITCCPFLFFLLAGLLGKSLTSKHPWAVLATLPGYLPGEGHFR